MKLKKVASTEIVPAAPFDFDSTFHKPDHFTSGDNYWEPGTRWQTWNWQGKQHSSLHRAHRVNIDIPTRSIDRS